MNTSNANTPTNRYGSLAAEIYDIDKPFGALPDTAFHLELLAAVKGEILEPACGSGRTLVPLLEAGHSVAGFDLSEEMLAQCRARCAERGVTADLSRQRFEDFTYDRTFAAIVVPVGSFTLIDRYETAVAVLTRFREFLAPGGRVILDIQPLSSMARTGEDRRQWAAVNGDLLTIAGTHVKTDWLGQTMEYHARYERWRDNVLVETQLEPMVQRFWSVQEMRLLLLSLGFAEPTITGGYEMRPPKRGDGTITFDTQKP